MNLIKIDKLPFEVSGLIKISDLIYFDGPILSFYIDSHNNSYLFYWVDSLDGFNRWMIIPTSIMEVNNYLNKRITLYDLITSKLSVFISDVDNRANFEHVYLCLTADLDYLYLPERESIYDFDENSGSVTLAFYSIIYRSGVLEVHFNESHEVGYGTIKLDLLAKALIHFSEMSDALGSCYYNMEKKKFQSKKSDFETEKEKKIIKFTDKTQFSNSTKLEVLANRAASFSLIMKPVEQELDLGTPTRTDKFIEFVVDFITASESVQKLGDLAPNLDTVVFNHYEELLKTIRQAKFKLGINYLNTRTNSCIKKSIASDTAEKIISNLELFDMDHVQAFSLSGRFTLLNIKSGQYRFESLDGNSSGKLEDKALIFAPNIAFYTDYQVEITRRVTKKASRRKTIITDAITSIIIAK